MPDSAAHDTLTAAGVMQTKLLTVSTTTPLTEVERLLGEYGFGGVPVTDEAGHLIGVVSMRDVLEHYASEPGAHPRSRPGFFETVADDIGELPQLDTGNGDETTAADVMTAEVYAVDADTPLRDVARQMVDRKIHRLLVRQDGHHVGMITAFDLLGTMAAR